MRRRSLRQEQITDWDGIATLSLTCLLTLLSAGLLLLPFLLRVYHTAQRAPVAAPHAEVLLLFGKQLSDGAMDDDFKQRVGRLATLLQEAPRRLTVLLGGRLPGQTVSEAQVAANYLGDIGVTNRSQLVLEHRSLHTLENLRNARTLLASESNDLRCTLITSRYHLARCQAIATGLGFQADVCAAEENLSSNWPTSLRLLQEAFLLAWYHTGRNWARLSRSRRMLERIS